MELTIHGSERILGRTRMLIKDVLFLISHDATISLGIDKEGREYLLFYSPPDGTVKIAVVEDATRSKIITVLEKFHHLPKCIQKVGRSLENRARTALNRQLRVQLFGKPAPTVIQHVVVVQVIVRNEVVAELQVDNFLWKGSFGTLDLFMPKLASKLKPLILALDEMTARIRTKKLYKIVFLDRETSSVIGSHLLKRSTIQRFIEGVT